jgi:hypothetical protein
MVWEGLWTFFTKHERGVFGSIPIEGRFGLFQGRDSASVILLGSKG